MSAMSGRARINRIGLLSLVAWSGFAAASGNAWHYTIDQPREEQQANFCLSEKNVEEVAGIFDRYGPRTGYSALSESPGCEIAVHTFTPRRVVKTVTVSEGKPGEYKVHFVEVVNDHGETLYLVTTREVVAE